MIFRISLYLALTTALAGSLYQVIRWYRNCLPTAHQTSSFSIGKLLRHLIKPRTWYLLFSALLLDVLLQRRLYYAHRWRWLIHLLMFYGFMLLLFMHALDGLITAQVFPAYASTLNPFRFLRTLGGVLLLTGLLFHLMRRLRSTPRSLPSNGHDILLLVLLATMVLSGFMLEALQLISVPLFNEMVETYMGADDPQEVQALRYYWSQKFGLPSAPQDSSGTPAMQALGGQLHADCCAECHSTPRTAWVAYPIARQLKPVVPLCNRWRLDRWMWYLHLLTCFLCLALLPFTKAFHFITTPLQNLVRRLAPQWAAQSPIGWNLGLAACTRCGLCNQHCSVGPFFQVDRTPTILPAQKLAALRNLLAGRLTTAQKHALMWGSRVCTDCYQCTQICPAGINLQALWAAAQRVGEQQTVRQTVRQRLPESMGKLQEGITNGHELATSGWNLGYRYEAPLVLAGTAVPYPETKLTGKPLLWPGHLEAWKVANCIQCSICSSVCPVLAAPQIYQPADVSPQQVINLLRLNLPALARQTSLVQNCLSCYLCQEYCPQHIPVADILYTLRYWISNAGVTGNDANTTTSALASSNP